MALERQINVGSRVEHFESFVACWFMYSIMLSGIGNTFHLSQIITFPDFRCKNFTEPILFPVGQRAIHPEVLSDIVLVVVERNDWVYAPKDILKSILKSVFLPVSSSQGDKRQLD